MVSPVSIHKGDLGSVIVGGREFNRLKPEESMKRYIIVHVHACVYVGPALAVHVCIHCVCTKHTSEWGGVDLLDKGSLYNAHTWWALF